MVRAQMKLLQICIRALGILGLFCEGQPTAIGIYRLGWTFLTVGITGMQ